MNIHTDINIKIMKHDNCNIRRHFADVNQNIMAYTPSKSFLFDW